MSSIFPLIFTMVLSMTLLSAGTSVHLVRQPTLTEQQNRIFQGALVGCTIGTTVMIGLLSHQFRP